MIRPQLLVYKKGRQKAAWYEKREALTVVYRKDRHLSCQNRLWTWLYTHTRDVHPVITPLLQQFGGNWLITKSQECVSLLSSAVGPFGTTKTEKTIWPLNCVWTRGLTSRGQIGSVKRLDSVYFTSQDQFLQI